MAEPRPAAAQAFSPERDAWPGLTCHSPKIESKHADRHSAELLDPNAIDLGQPVSRHEETSSDGFQRIVLARHRRSTQSDQQPTGNGLSPEPLIDLMR